MSTIVIMAGGFHPFHAGHTALYQSIKRAFPDAEVFVAATNDTSSRPFPFAVKEKLAKLAGVEPGHFVQVKSPFRAEEITSHFDPERDRLIFVRSEKDATKPPQAGGVKKNGEPAYLQPLLGAKRLEPFSQHAYMAYLPTVEFGPGMTSATEIRGAWPTLNEKRKTALVMSLYPATQKNPKLAANVVKMLDTAIGQQDLNEFAPGNGGGESGRWYTDDQMTDIVGNGWWQDLDISSDLSKQEMIDLAQIWLHDQGYTVHVLNVKVNDDDCEWYIEGSFHNPRFAKKGLTEFAPDDGGESRKFIPWTEFVDQLKQILHKDFDCKESINQDVIKAKFVPYDPMEFGPTQIYSYFERRMGRDKGANSVRGQIQVGKFSKGQSGLITGYHLLKGTEFERYFDLTFDNLYKIANIIKGNTRGRLEMQPQQGMAEEEMSPIAERSVDETRIIDPRRIDVFYRPDPRNPQRRVVARNIPTRALDLLLGKLSNKFGIPERDFEWSETRPDVSENQGWAATLESDLQTAGTPAPGGMWAGYQQRENQPVDEDYIDEKWSEKYKRSINCANPKGFSQRAHCAGRKK